LRWRAILNLGVIDRIMRRHRPVLRHASESWHLGALRSTLVIARGRRRRDNPELNITALDCFVGFASSQ